MPAQHFLRFNLWCFFLITLIIPSWSQQATATTSGWVWAGSQVVPGSRVLPQEVQGRNAKSEISSFSDIFAAVTHKQAFVASTTKKPHIFSSSLVLHNGDVRTKDYFWPVSDLHRSTTTTARPEVKKQFTYLDVHHPQSPYGLIQEVLSPKLSRPSPLQLNQLSYNDDLGGLATNEVWLSEGDLLVLKGGLTKSEGFDTSWPPLDNYQAPYREPVLAPTNAHPVIQTGPNLSILPAPTQIASSYNQNKKIGSRKPKTFSPSYPVNQGFQPVNPSWIETVTVAPSTRLNNNRNVVKKEIQAFSQLSLLPHLKKAAKDSSSGSKNHIWSGNSQISAHRPLLTHLQQRPNVRPTFAQRFKHNTWRRRPKKMRNRVVVRHGIYPSQFRHVSKNTNSRTFFSLTK